MTRGSSQGWFWWPTLHGLKYTLPAGAPGPNIQSVLFLSARGRIATHLSLPANITSLHRVGWGLAQLRAGGQVNGRERGCESRRQLCPCEQEGITDAVQGGVEEDMQDMANRGVGCGNSLQSIILLIF